MQKNIPRWGVAIHVKGTMIKLPEDIVEYVHDCGQAGILSSTQRTNHKKETNKLNCIELNFNHYKMLL